MKILKATTLSKILLVRLYRDFITDAYEVPGKDNITNMFDGRVSKNLLVVAVDLLAQDKRISKTDQKDGGYTVILQPRGREIVESWLETEDADAMEYFKKGNNYLDQFEGLLPKANGGADSLDWIPASDRIVTLDHNKPEYKDAIKSIDTAIEAIRGDNEYGARDPEGKARNLIQLEAGRKLLDAITASVKVVEGLLIKTLVYLAGIGVAVSQVVDAIEKAKLLLGP